ncbi:hypothetical protein BGZ73_006698 [Actinomortierella ambigua]|nr:hypothetical protein BGZ73_006698 [Actinomortierella ambigua]
MSNEAPKSAQEISWLPVDTVAAETLVNFQSDVIKLRCTVDSTGAFTILSFRASGTSAVMRYDPAMVLQPNHTFPAWWSNPVLAKGVEPNKRTSILFSVPQQVDQDLVYHAAVNNGGSGISFGYLNTTNHMMEYIPTQWNLSSTLNGASIRRLDYSNNTLFALTSSNQSLSLLTMPVSMVAGTVPSAPRVTVHTWTQSHGANCTEATVLTSSMDQSFFSFCRANTGKMQLFAFNGTHTQDPIPVNEAFDGSLRSAAVVDKTFLIFMEQVKSDDRRQVVSGFSLRNGSIGSYSQGLYVASITDEYDIERPVITQPVSYGNDKREVSNVFVIVIGSLACVLLLSIVTVLLVYGRQSKMLEKEDEESEGTVNTSGDGNDDEDKVSQKQPAGDEEDDIPWVDELPGKLVLVEEEEEEEEEAEGGRGRDSLTGIAEDRNDVIIPLSIIVAPSAPSLPSPESPSSRHSPISLPTPPPIQSVTRRQVIVLATHPRPSFVTSMEHDTSSEDEENTQEPVQALTPLTTPPQVPWHHQETPLQTPSSYRNAAFADYFASPSAPTVEGIQQQLSFDTLDAADGDEEPLPVYEG